MTHIYGQFPTTRFRRLRQAPWIRDLVAETTLTVKDLVWPLFIRDPKTQRDVAAMPGVCRYTVEELVPVVRQAVELGIPAIALFPVTPLSLKTLDGKEALNPDNLVCQALRHIKSHFPHMGIFTDVALDPYTTHGHDGVLVNDDIANDATVEILCQQALVQAEAGSDVLAPSDMMDGRIKAIRKALDDHGFTHKSILSYSAKYASSFYGPFREAVGAQSLAGKSDKRTYQMNPANREEAVRETALDIEEGADMVMIKPGLPYLDIINVIKETFQMPTFAYHVSGEYAMIKAAAQNGWLNGPQAMMESLVALKRAGSDGIFTYAALEISQVLRGME